MKKNLILAMAVVAAMVSCQKEVEPVAISQTDGDAVSFSAYSSVATTRGEITAPDSLKAKGTDLRGIGVFAFYQPNNQMFNTHKFSTPDFMYNQRVYNQTSIPVSDQLKISGSDWKYTPLKYWPNNVGDHVSFFAYAPYDANKQWTDLGINTDQNNTKMTVNFPIYNDAKDQIDYIWAHPQINLRNAATASTYTDNAYIINNKVVFNFKHITSQVSLYVGVDQNTVTTTGTAPYEATAWETGSGDAAKTEIVVNSIEFTNLDDNLTYEYKITSDSVLNTPPTIKTCTTKQDITLTAENFYSKADTINTTNYATSVSEAKANGEPGYFNRTYFKQLTKDDNYMFLAPKATIASTDDTKVIITYTVTTTDSDNPANSSTIVNKITKNLSDLVTSLVAGSAYRFFFLIGMNQVNITASETAWVEEGDHQVDVPANK